MKVEYYLRERMERVDNVTQEEINYLRHLADELRMEEAMEEGIERVIDHGAGLGSYAEQEMAKKLERSDWVRKNITKIPASLRVLVQLGKYSVGRLFRRWPVCLELLLPEEEEQLINTKMALVCEEMQALFTKEESLKKEIDEDFKPDISDEMASTRVLEAVKMAKEEVKERRIRAAVEYESLYCYEEEHSFDSWYYESN